ncbi:hypothetical protein NC651_000132 [Populus alba x Populus x berolinensis]|nr:hypothetical protein NC651_000132 [Populus alba x Populus x berolinensis]
MLLVLMVAHGGDKVGCTQWVAIPDDGSALSLFCGGEERTNGGSRRALRVLSCCCGSSSPPLPLLPWFFLSLFCSVSLHPLWFCWCWHC